MGQNVHSFKVLGALSAYRGVAAVSSTANTVQYPEAATNPYLGVLKDESTLAGQSVPVAVSGERAKLFFNDTCAAGQRVGLDSSGRGVAYVQATGTTYSIGVLIGATVAVTGTIAEILVQPQATKLL